jgi:hypothetical protein
MNNYEKRHMEQGKQKDEPIKMIQKSRLLALQHGVIICFLTTDRPFRPPSFLLFLFYNGFNASQPYSRIFSAIYYL